MSEICSFSWLHCSGFKDILVHWDDPEGLGAGREGDDRGRDGWMASLTRWM